VAVFHPPEEIKKNLGEFPFFSFWGPAAGIDSPQGKADAASRWIAESAKWIENKYAPTLNLIYLPHLDYNLQRHGVYTGSTGVSPVVSGVAPETVGGRTSDLPSSALQQSTSPHEIRRDAEFDRRDACATNPKIHHDLCEIDAIVGDLIDFFGKRGVQVVLLSEYGITNVDLPVHLNRIFRERGWLTVKDELGLEILDAGASKVFAVAIIRSRTFI
jgi:predicted AlkP superfamily pyrophosphatase or phosphodiesterase